MIDGNLIAITILAVVALLLIAQYARERSIRRASEKRINRRDGVS